MKMPPVLIDFDGVLKIGNSVAEDANEFLNYLDKNDIPFFVISNSTLRTSDNLKKFLYEHGIKVKLNAMTTVDASLNYIKNYYKKISVYCIDEIKKVFEEYIDDKKPEAVLIGDIGKNWNYETLNDIFRKVYSGADLIAMQKNKFWKPDGTNLCLDAGSFIAAIEHASSKNSILIGKPSELYFKSALEMLGFKNAENFIMIGDDLETDIVGSQKIGGKGILVFTGKTKYPLPKDSSIKPNYEAKNLTEVISILNSIENRI